MFKTKKIIVNIILFFTICILIIIPDYYYKYYFNLKEYDKANKYLNINIFTTIVAYILISYLLFQLIQVVQKFKDKRKDQISVSAMQQAPTIRMLQSSDEQMYEKIQSSIINSIPMWRTQLVYTIGLEHSKRATDAQGYVEQAELYLHLYYYHRLQALNLGNYHLHLY